MLIHLGRQSSPWIRLFRWVGLLVVLAAVVGTGLFLLRRGGGRTDLYRVAIEALARGDRKTAEAHFCSLLKSGTQRRDVATQLMAILLEDERYEEAEAYARKWRSEPQLAVVGWRGAIEIALRQLRLVEAEELAREQADLDPEFAQFTILRVRDLMGSFNNRWAAQRAAVALATLTPSEEVRTRTFLFAAETLRDLLDEAKGPVKDAVWTAYRRSASAARTSLLRMREVPSPVEPPAVKELRARIALLSEVPEERRGAEKALRAVLAAAPAKHKKYEVRASLQAYAASMSFWDDAVADAEKLADGPPLLWLRAVQRLEARGRDEDVLRLLRDAPLRDDPLVALYEARVLLEGKTDAKARGLEILEVLVRRETLHPSLALEAYRLLVDSGRAPAGIESLVEMASASGDVLAEAALVEVLSAAGERERALSVVRGIANHVENLPQALLVLSLLRRGDDEAFLTEYLQAPIDASTADAARRHFVRAAAAAAQAPPGPDTSDARMLRAAARGDLEALRRVDVRKADLAQAWRIALSLGEPGLTGRLAARAIAAAGPPHDLAFGLLAWAAATDDDVVRREVADGLRAEAGTTSIASFLETLADLVVEHPDDPSRIRTAFERLAEEGGSVLPSLYLQAQAAWFAGEVEEGEGIARRLHEQSPDSLEARDLLGAFLLRRGEWGEVVALHEGDVKRSLASYRQLVIALEQTGNTKRSLPLARRAVREHPNTAEAHLLLAEVLWRHGERTKALGVLSVAPPTPDVNVLRARLLAEEGESAVAEGLLRDTIAAHPHDVRPWRRLYLLLTETGERGRLIQTVTEALERPLGVDDGTLKADLLLMRGMARLARGEEDTALRDFEAVITLRPKDSVALNNAAWLLVEHRRERLDDALDYVRRAVEVDPSNGDIHDTAAVVLLHRGDFVAALASADRAVTRAEADEKEGHPAKPGFRLHRAIILDRLERTGEATRELEAVAEEYPDGLAGIRAASILKRRARGSR